MFSQASVILFTGGHAWQGYAWGGLRGRGACIAGGTCVAGGHACVTWSLLSPARLRKARVEF